MSHKNLFENWLAVVPEASPLVGPVSWTGLGVMWLEHLSADVSGLKETRIADMTLARRATNVKGHMTIAGPRNCQMTVGLKLHGSPPPLLDAQIAQSYLGFIFAHCLGASFRSTSHACDVGGTAAAPILASVAGLIPGCYLAFENKTNPVSSEVGRLHPRCILSIDVGTKEVTLDRPLPFTPGALDIAHAVEQAFPSGDILTDAFQSNTTAQWFVKKARTGTDLLWTCDGSVATMKIDGLSKGGLPSVMLTIDGANFKTSDEDGLTSPSPTTFLGSAQLAVGLDNVLLIDEYGEDTLTRYDCSSIAFEPGIARTRINGNATTVPRADGTIGYGFVMNDTTLSVTIAPYSRSWYTALKLGKTYNVSYYQPGDGTGPGKGYAICCRRMQLAEMPTRADVDNVHGVALKFLAMEPDDADVAANEDCERAIMSILTF